MNLSAVCVPSHAAPTQLYGSAGYAATSPQYAGWLVVREP